MEQEQITAKEFREKYLKPSRNKFNAKSTTVDGWHFPSKKEAAYYVQLKLRQAAGEVAYFLRQVPFHLPSGIIYRVDFVEFWHDGSIHYVDTKGVETKVFRMKKKMVEHYFPVRIEVK